MLRISGCGLFIILFIFASFYVYAQEAMDLDKIIVSKSKIYTYQEYCLEAEDIASLPYNSLIEYFSVLPLDSQSRSAKGGIQSDFSIRGSNFTGVLFLINGQRINDPQTAHHNSDIPFTKEDIREINILPGVSSSLFGPDAIGGAVNIILNKPKENKLVFESSYGSYHSWSGLTSISRVEGDLGIRFSVEKEKAGAFIYDRDFDNFTSSFSSFLDIPLGELAINFGYQDKEFGAFDFYTPYLGFPSREWTKTYLIDSTVTLEKDGFIIKPNFLWRRHFDKFVLDETQVRSKYLNYHRSDVYAPNIYLQRPGLALGDLGLGLGYSQESIRSTNLGKHSRSHQSIFLDDSKNLTDRLSLGLSARFDNFDGFGEVASGSANLKLLASDFNAFSLGISRNIRIPSFTELYYNDPTTIGNPDLSEEESLNYQLGYEYNDKGSLSFGAMGFFRREDNFIDWVKYSATQAKWEAENITEAKVSGVEAFLKFKINQYLDISSNYTYVNKIIDDQGLIYKYGPSYTKHLWNNLLSIKLPFGKQGIGLGYNKKPGRNSYLLVNTRFSYDINNYTQAFLIITNLTNTAYEEIDGVPQPGRWFEAGVRLEW